MQSSELTGHKVDALVGVEGLPQTHDVRVDASSMPDLCVQVWVCASMGVYVCVRQCLCVLV